MGPVISQSAMKTILDYIEVGKKEGKLLTGGKRAAGDGHFIEPTIIAGVDPKARVGQGEVFGPGPAGVQGEKFAPGPGNWEKKGIWFARPGYLKKPGKN